jgi:hypothetical protein
MPSDVTRPEDALDPRENLCKSALLDIIRDLELKVRKYESLWSSLAEHERPSVYNETDEPPITHFQAPHEDASTSLRAPSKPAICPRSQMGPVTENLLMMLLMFAIITCVKVINVSDRFITAFESTH